MDIINTHTHRQLKITFEITIKIQQTNCFDANICDNYKLEWKMKWIEIWIELKIENWIENQDS